MFVQSLLKRGFLALRRIQDYAKDGGLGTV